MTDVGSGYGERLDRELCDWVDNGLRDSSQDALIAIESFGHMEPDAALAECRTPRG